MNPPQTTPIFTPNAGTPLDADIVSFSDSQKVTLRAATKTYLTALYGDGSALSATQRFAIQEAIAKIDEETAAGPRPEISVSNSVANGVMYGLRTAYQVAPAITSALTATGTHGSAITPYHIAGSHTPLSYSATPLPTGLTLDPATGIISGTPASAGSTTTTIGATNAGGTGTGALVWTIA